MSIQRNYPDGILDSAIETILTNDRNAVSFKKYGIGYGGFPKAPDLSRWENMPEVNVREAKAYRWVLQEARNNGGWVTFFSKMHSEFCETLKELIVSCESSYKSECTFLEEILKSLTSQAPTKEVLERIFETLMRFKNKKTPPMAEKASSLCFTLYVLLVTQEKGGIEKYDDELKLMEKDASRFEIRKVIHAINRELDFRDQIDMILAMGIIFGATRLPQHDKNLKNYNFNITSEDQRVIDDIRGEIKNLLERVEKDTLLNQTELTIMRDWKIAINSLQGKYMDPALRKITNLETAVSS